MLPVSTEITEVSELCRKDFNWFRRFIETETGIRIRENKYVFMYNRLFKRVKLLGLKSIPEYREFLESRDTRNSEKEFLFEEIVISESSFFRYEPQFDFFRKKVLPDLVKNRVGKGDHVSIFSMGSSRGQEIYSVAMLVSEALPPDQRLFVRLSAVDISSRMLNEAIEAYYPDIDVKSVPPAYLDRYFIRERGGYRILPRVAGTVKFSKFNLLHENWRQFRSADVIFCRNTLIYFGDQVKSRIIERMSSSLRRGGYLILGHSEMIDALDFGLEHLGSNIYRKDRP